MPPVEETTKFVVDAVPLTERLVVVALVPVALPKTKGPVSVVEAEDSPPLKVRRVEVELEGNS